MNSRSIKESKDVGDISQVDTHSDIRYTHSHMHIHACIHMHTQGRKAYKQLIRCGTAWFQQVSLVQLAHAAALYAPDAGENFDFESQCGLETQRPRRILEPHLVPKLFLLLSLKHPGSGG